MPEELVVRQCAPTLAGIKTGSLFRAAYEDKKQLLGQIREINQRLREKGLCLLPLRFRNGNALQKEREALQSGKPLHEQEPSE